MYDYKNIDYNQVANYLKMSKISSEDINLFDNVKKILFEIASPKLVEKVEDVKKVNGYYYLPESKLYLESNDINKYFIDVEKIGVCAVTIGISVDRKIEYYSKIDMKKAMVLDAMSSVYVENVMDKWEYEMHNRYPDYEFCMRYSCGYGDLSIEMQSQIINALNATKLAGITVSKSNIMIPQKSITAFLGLTKTKTNKEIDICKTCKLQGRCVTKCRRARQYGK